MPGNLPPMQQDTGLVVALFTKKSSFNVSLRFYYEPRQPPKNLTLTAEICRGAGRLMSIRGRVRQPGYARAALIIASM